MELYYGRVQGVDGALAPGIFLRTLLYASLLAGGAPVAIQAWCSPNFRPVKPKYHFGKRAGRWRASGGGLGSIFRRWCRRSTNGAALLPVWVYASLLLGFKRGIILRRRSVGFDGALAPGILLRAFPYVSLLAVYALAAIQAWCSPKCRSGKPKCHFGKWGIYGALVVGLGSIFRAVGWGVDDVLMVWFYAQFWFTRRYWWGSSVELYYGMGSGRVAGALVPRIFLRALLYASLLAGRAPSPFRPGVSQIPVPENQNTILGNGRSVARY